MQSRSIVLITVALVLMLGVSGGLHAQVSTASIVGRAADQTGGVLPGVTVTITSPVLLVSQSATTVGSGRYRFAELPIGTYTVTFELSGFKTVVRSDVILSAAFTATVNVDMELAQVAETVTVSGESPVIDVRSTVVKETFDRQRLEEIPTSRDPWVIIEQTPGIVMDRQNVGGNESGQQSGWSTRGTPSNQNVWYYDGINITDMGASGASPGYFDFNAFEEINVATGGQDADAQTSGTYINFLVKQGTNDIHGGASWYLVRSSMQSDNITPALEAQGAGAGAPIKQIDDYGFELGGPVIKDRLWVFGDYGVQDIKRGTLGFFVPGCEDTNSADCLEPDPTFLRNNNIKANAQITQNNTFNFLWMRNEKIRATRGASDTRPLETTWQQGGPTNIYKFEDTHVFNDSFLMTGRFAYVSGGFFLTYQDPSLREVQANYELSNGAYSKSYLEYKTERPQYVANLDGNYFLGNSMGGDHEFKFGFQYKKATVNSFTNYGGDVWAIFDGGEASEAWFFREGLPSYQGNFLGLHIQDIYTRGNATLKLALRYDRSASKNLPSSNPANMAAPNRMPGISYEGDSGFTWNRMSPRVGFTYDLSGDGKSVVKANYSLYYDILDMGLVTSFNNSTSVSEIDLPWTDVNGDGLVQEQEADWDTVYYTSNFDPNNPTSVVSPDIRDANLEPGRTDEIILGAEREIAPNVAIEGNYIYKRFTNQHWLEWPYSGNTGTDGMSGLTYPGVDSSGQQLPGNAWVPVTTNAEGQNLTYYELAEGYEKAGDFLTNRPDYNRSFNGVELAVHKRMSDGWMLNAAYSYNSATEGFGSDAAIADPTNIDLRSDGQVADYSGGSGKRRFFMNSKWVFRLDGMYRFPFGLSFAGSWNGRQGFPFMESIRTDNRAGALGRGEVMLAPPGDSRLESLWVANFRVEYTFHLKRADIGILGDLFNLGNNATVLKREMRQNFSNANNIQDILSPRVFRIGFRLRF